MILNTFNVQFNSTKQICSTQKHVPIYRLQITDIRTKLTLTVESLQDICTFVFVLMV